MAISRIIVVENNLILKVIRLRRFNNKALKRLLSNFLRGKVYLYT